MAVDWWRRWRREWRGDWEAAARALSGRQALVRVGGRVFRVPFVGRVGELAWLISDWGVRGVTVLVGPRGCGKTALMQVALQAAGEARGGLEVLYVAHDPKGYVSKLAASSRSLLDEARRLVGEAFSRAAVEAVVLEPLGVPGLAVRGLRFTLIEALAVAARLLRGRKRLLLLVDEFREAMELGAARQVLEVDANEVLYAPEGVEVKAVYSTSDATAARLAPLVGDKVSWVLVWNLPKSDFRGLYRSLRRQMGLARGPGYELVWQLAGGNPRHLTLMAENRFNLEAYLERHVIDPLVNMLLRYAEKSLGGEDRASDLLRGEARRYVEDAGKAYTRLYDALEERNIVMEHRLIHRRLTRLPEKEPWVGEWWAFQIPAYYWALKAMVERGRLRVEPREVLEEVRRHIRR